MLLVYVAFLTKTYYWDGVLFSLHIEEVSEGTQPFAALLHPNHLLYSVVGYAGYQLASISHVPVRAITILQFVNSLASAASAYLLFSVARHLSGSIRAAAAACVLFACGATWWKFSTDADAYILSILLLSIAVVLAVKGQAPLAGMSHAAAMLIHELAIFGFVPILVSFVLYRRKPRFALAYCATAVIPVATAYWFAYLGADHSTYPTLFSWIASSSSESKTTHSLTQLLVTNALSYVKLFAGGRWSLVRQFLSLPVYAAIACSLCLLAYGVWRVLRAEPRSRPTDIRITWILIAWVAPYALFLSWFEPGNAFYKLFIWPPIVMLIAYAARRYEAAALPLALALAFWNFGAFIFPHAQVSADPVLELAGKIDRELPKSATIYYRQFVPDDWYLRYFAPGRNWTPLPAKKETTPGPVCFETTALDVVSVPASSNLRWDLVNHRHNVKLECRP